MKILSCIEAAKAMGIPRQDAVNARLRFVVGRMDEIDAKLLALEPWFKGGGVNAAFVEPEVCDLLIEKCRLYLEHGYTKTRMTKRPAITDDMIDKAREYPVTQLVEFRHGKALAWCHQDSRPSLCHMTRINKAWCPVCNRYFSAIDVVMTRDGLSFLDAVRSLQ